MNIHAITSGVGVFGASIYSILYFPIVPPNVLIIRTGVCAILGLLVGHSMGDVIDPNSKPASLLFDIIPRLFHLK